MGIVKATVKGTHATIFFLLALSTATIMTISNPRPASAEGPLLGTVDCLLRTILTGPCKSAEAPTQTTKPATSSSSPSQPASSQAASTGNVATSDKKTYNTIAMEPMNVPENLKTIPTEVTSVSAITSNNDTTTGAEYLTYFNKYSKYAVAGAKQQAAVAPIERTGEGWRLFGVAWYWWGMGLLALAVIITSVNRRISKKI
ncbi:MAG: hypothetical protein ACOH18_05165 [Candidatus Saccharimonadaceae bacterium]